MIHPSALNVSSSCEDDKQKESHRESKDASWVLPVNVTSNSLSDSTIDFVYLSSDISQ